MKTSILKTWIIALIILPMTLVSCHDEFFIGISGQGDVTEETLYVDEFNGFISTIAADIYLTQGDKQEVVIEAQQNIIDNINLDRLDDGIWTIGYHRPVISAKPVKIYITIPTLTKAAISGSGDLKGLTPFTGLDNLKLMISGSGSMDLETESNKMDVVISGSGDIKITGETGNLDLLISGSGSFQGSDLVTTKADLTISGSGGARVAVEDFLQVFVSGSGSVYYSGNPEIDVRVSGSGRVIHNN
jgi:hypothetical protein